MSAMGLSAGAVFVSIDDGRVFFVRPECGLAGPDRCEPVLPRRFLFATPLVAALGLDSLFVLIILAGFFQVLVSFAIGVSAGLVYRVMRQLA